MVCADAQAQIVFSSDRDWQDWHWEIYVMDSDGGNQRNLTNNLAEDRNPSWSPDGKQVVFTSDRDDRGGRRQIYVMDNDGNNQRNLSNNDFDDQEPSWSPDGKRIAFVSFGPGGNKDLVMDANGQRNLTNHNDRSAPAWFGSANG